jgi:MoxR-like ATPase
VTFRDVEVGDVELAMAEAEELGREPFLEKYGFGFSTRYLVRHAGHFYDPKALIGVAHAYRDDQGALTRNDFDATQAVAQLRSLGFEVVSFSGLWWVNQGATFRQERQGGYVWAPKLTKAGRPAAHHVAVSQLRVGQTVVHYADGAIRAIGYVADVPQSVLKPNELTTDAWDVDGYGCAITYRDVSPPIPKQNIPNRTKDVGPFDVNGDLKQGYLFPVENAQTFPLLEFLNAHIPDLFTPPERAHISTPLEEGPVPQDPDPIHDLLLSAKNVVLEGVPGTGKSFAIEGLAKRWHVRTGRDLITFNGTPYTAVVMHPSSSYEDFIEGLRPRALGSGEAAWFDEAVESGGEFVVEDGFFLRVCAVAARNPDRDVLVLIDEMNRCNVPSVLGDLLLTIEASRRAKYADNGRDAASAVDWHTAVPVRLPYSGRTFFVPDNVYVVATTNTTDRSVAPLDAAIRRRFAFYRLEPDFGLPAKLASEVLGSSSALVQASAEVLRQLNDAVMAPCLGPDAMLGQSYLYSMIAELQRDGGSEAVARIWRFSVVPQLIDVLRSYGAEALLDPETRATWFAEHGTELVTDVDSANEALRALDAHLRGCGMRVRVTGTGLSRGARVLDATSGRADLSSQPVDLGSPELNADISAPQA